MRRVTPMASPITSRNILGDGYARITAEKVGYRYSTWCSRGVVVVKGYAFHAVEKSCFCRWLEGLYRTP